MFNSNELIKVTYSNNRPTVLGRDLHKLLEVESNYTTWFKRMCDYGFIQEVDFIPFLEESTGGRPSQDHQLTIEMAKEISMLQRNEKGKQVRQYFIQLEKKWNSPEIVMARALKLADSKIVLLENKIEEDKPKVEQFDRYIDTDGTLSINQAAKALKTGRNKLMEFLRHKNVLNEDNSPSSYYAGRNYFSVKTITYKTKYGNEYQTVTTRVTSLGMDFLYRYLRKHYSEYVVFDKNFVLTNIDMEDKTA